MKLLLPLLSVCILLSCKKKAKPTSNDMAIEFLKERLKSIDTITDPDNVYMKRFMQAELDSFEHAKKLE